jgi:hypothetical protein
VAYIDVSDIRSEGVMELIEDDRIETCITLAQSLIERLTGMFYEARSDYVLQLDGRDNNLLRLPVPPAATNAISTVTIDDEVLEDTDYRVIMPQVPDGRLNSKIMRIGGVWPRGTGNVTLTGTFGYVDVVSEGVYRTPDLIKELCKRITIWGLPEIADAEAQKSSRIISEAIGNYRYQLSEAERNGYFGDVRIDNLIAMFRRPRICVV